MRRTVRLGALVLGLAILGGALTAEAQVPRHLNFQGRLADINKVPQTGTFSVTFTLWDALTSGTQCFSEIQSVPVNSGLFSVLIGSATSGGIGTCDFSKPYWLQIQIAGDALAMSPRLPLTAAPYAFNADRLDGYDADRFVQQTALGDVTHTGKIGVGKTPTYNLDVAGRVRGNQLCLGADCLASWYPGTVTSMGGGTGITLSTAPSAITATGTVSVNQSTMQNRVTGTCASGYGMYQINADGTVGCAAVPASDTSCYYQSRSWGSGSYCSIDSYYRATSCYDYTRATCSNGVWSITNYSCASTVPSAC